ncbi:MAG: hypothetical protein KBF32_07760 [Chitinophagales bacterium]|nr:hypothetical protein [Chitinophagaceae bacterium]MBP9883281.1 hypothetical protein [Chitinophagales bacterium]
MATAVNLKKAEKEKEVMPEQQPVKVVQRKRNWLYESLDLSRWVHYQTIIRNLPFVFFMASIAILYIANAHYAEKNVRELNQIERKMNEMRWEYMTTKSELENISKQSEVAKLVAPSGLKELREPPRKIVVKKR